MKILITGGCGFVGHHVVEHTLRATDWDVVVFDKLTYASSGYDRLRDIAAYDDKRVSVFSVDLAAPIPVGVAREVGHVEYILHLAAESHVDRSIADPLPFIEANVLGTYQMLQYARTIEGLKRFLYFSTDEVFGPADEGVFFDEWARFKPSNPYAATKAGGEALVDAWARTYSLPAFTTHTMNVFGERQHPEKFIPLVLRSVLEGSEILIHADPKCAVPGARCWIHARNVADAVFWLLPRSTIGEKYNIAGPEISNLGVAEIIASEVGKELKYKLVNFHESRPGHDLRYALSGEKLKRMGYEYPVDLEKSLRKTVRWMLDRPEWLVSSD